MRWWPRPRKFITLEDIGASHVTIYGEWHACDCMGLPRKMCFLCRGEGRWRITGSKSIERPSSKLRFVRQWVDPHGVVHCKVWAKPHRQFFGTSCSFYRRIPKKEFVRDEMVTCLACLAAVYL